MKWRHNINLEKKKQPYRVDFELLSNTTADLEPQSQKAKGFFTFQTSRRVATIEPCCVPRRLLKNSEEHWSLSQMLQEVLGHILIRQRGSLWLWFQIIL